MRGRTTADLGTRPRFNLTTLSQSLSSKATHLRTPACRDSRLALDPDQSLFPCPTMCLDPLAPLPLLSITPKEESLPKSKQASPPRRGWVLPVQSHENEGSRDAGRGTRGSRSREVTPSMSLAKEEVDEADCPPPATPSPTVSLEATSGVTSVSSHRWLSRGQMTSTGTLSTTKAGNSAKTCPTSSS